MRNFSVHSCLRFMALFSAVALLCQAADPPSVTAIRNRLGGTTAAAGDVVELLGSGLATDSNAASAWPIPFISGTTTVTCNGMPAPILASAPDRVRIQLPWELTGLKAAEIVVKAGGLTGAPVTFPLAAFAPAVAGAGPLPAMAGKALTLSVTGMGMRGDNPATGEQPSNTVSGQVYFRFYVLLGGVPAPVLATRLADTGDVQSDAGVELVTVQIPANAPAGENVPLQITIGGVSSDPFPVSVAKPDVEMSLSPVSVLVPVGGAVKFGATVQGAADPELVWRLDQNAYDSSYSLPAGQVSAGVFYAAYTMTIPAWGIVRATHKSGAFATALMQLTPKDGKVYRIVPDNPVISAGETVAMTLIGPEGSAVPGANWYMEGVSGSANSYAAPLNNPPAYISVYGYLAGVPVATTRIAVNPVRPQVSGTFPAVGHAGEAMTIQHQGYSSRSAVRFPMADGGIVRVTGLTGSAGTTVTVPHGAASGQAWLEISPRTGDSGSTFSTPFAITILPRLRLHAARSRVSSGETVQIVAAAPAAPGNWPATWKADFGSVDSGGRFTAPNVMSPVYARIRACLLQDTECASTVVKVVPFRLDPDPTILKPGVATKLRVWQGAGPVTALWSAVTKNISVLPDGTVTPGTGPFDGGTATVTANFGGNAQNFEVSLTGVGSVANTSEYDDWLNYDNHSPVGRLAFGAFGTVVASHGDWVYVLSRNFLPGGYLPSLRAAWMDVYQLDANRNPVWVDAVDVPYLPFPGEEYKSVYTEGNSLCVIGQEGNALGLLFCYDISGGRPVMQSRQTFNGMPTGYIHRGIAGTVTGANPNISPSGPSPALTLELTDYAAGEGRKLPLHYTPVYNLFASTVTATAGWAAVVFNYSFSQSGSTIETVVFDTTGAGAEPIAYLPGGGSVTILQDLLVVDGDVYQVRGSDVALVSQIPVRSVVDFDPSGKRVLGLPTGYSQAEGYRVADLSDAANPKVSAPVESPLQHTGAALGSDYFVLLGSPQNVAVYPISYAPGVKLLDSFPSSAPMTDLRIRDNYLYWTGFGIGHRGRPLSRDIFEVVDLSVRPYRTVATLDRRGDETGWAIELIDRYAYVGTDSELIVYDISVPSSPSVKTVIGVPAVSMALSGKYLYVSSYSGKIPLIVIFDISDPANPVQAGKLLTPAPAYTLTAQSGWLALAMGRAGLAVYSTANPVNPAPVASDSVVSWGVASSAGVLYVAADSGGLLAYDMNVPGKLLSLSGTSLDAGHETPFYAKATAVTVDSQGLVWVCTAKDGRVYGLDMRDPVHPRYVTEISGQGAIFTQTNAIRSNGKLFILGDDDKAFDTMFPQNVGIYQVDQSWPGMVSPDRLNERQLPLPPEVRNVDKGEPRKAEAIRQRMQQTPE